jgi:fluoride exporter
MFGTILQIAVGGALGAVARYLTVELGEKTFGPTFPFGTMIANLLGSFLMGLAMAWLVEQRDIARETPFVMAGFISSYTTFASYAKETVELWKSGATVEASFYMLGSVVVSLAAFLAGLMLARSVPT